MGRGCDRPELRCWTSDHSHGAREDARSHKEEAVSAAKRRASARCARTAVLHVLTRVHVEICKTVHSIGREVYRRLLRHDARAYQTDLRFRARGFTTNSARRIQWRWN